MMCFGALLMSISIYFDAGAIESRGLPWTVLDRICVVQLWCFYCGLLIVLVALICKIWRAEKVCKFRKGRKILVHHVLWPLLAIVGVEIVLLVVATVVCPPNWEEREFLGESMKLDKDCDTIEDPDLLIPKCFYDPLPSVIALKATSSALIIVCQIVVIWMGHQTRNIPDEIVDTKRVYYLMMCQFVLYVLMVLLEFEVIPSGRAFSYLSLIFPFLFSITAVGFLVGPKVYCVFYVRRYGNLPKSFRSTVTAGQVHVSGLAKHSSVRTVGTEKRSSVDNTAPRQQVPIEVITSNSDSNPDERNSVLSEK